MANKTTIYNNFFYGEIGQRLNGQRTSEIYNSSLASIENLLISDLGTLKVSKKFEATNLSISGDIKDTISTSLDYYLILTTTNLYLINKSNNAITKSISHSLGNKVGMTLISKDDLLLYAEGHNTKLFSLKNNDIINNTMDLQFPIDNRESLELNLWKIEKDPIDETKKRLVTIGSSLKNPLIEIENNIPHLINSDIKINRIYINYKQVTQTSDFDKPVIGEIYGVLRILYKVENDKEYILGNENVTLGTLTDDAVFGGKYFSQIVGNNTKGEFSFGTLVNISQPEVVSFYQNRTVFYKDGILYFSKVRDYFNFKNGTALDDALFLQLNPINNRRGVLRGLISSTGLYIITSVGIYILGYGITITPSTANASVYIATDMGVGTEYQLINNILYFINENKTLKAITLDRTSQQIAFSTFTIDKYSTNPRYDYLSRLIIEDKSYLIATNTISNKMYLFEPLDYNGTFRKNHLIMNLAYKNILSIDDRIITKDKIYMYGNNNYDKCSIKINPMSLNGNSILCDNPSKVTSVNCRFINEDRLGIKGVKINDINIQNLGTNVPDLYSIYKVKSNFKVGGGFVIDIFTNENEKIIELQTIQMNISVNSDI